ncbi:hypothetical protein [Henriciella marina]|uniref:hypothetical protein n=1 Tax=Henriciella marina TaxID=453851 RepID=UPI00036C64BC|nr:hypothetical protein [Henriciella marina]
MSEENFKPVKLSDEARRAQKRRNLWLALALITFVVLVALTTIMRLGGGVPERM